MTNGLGAFLDNLWKLPQTFRESLIRHGAPTSDRARSQTVFGNFFLHIHATRIHRDTLRLRTTWGLGVSLVAQFLILTVTGILLMVYYKASTDLAYDSIKDLHYVVPTGRFIRNIHRWAAHLMVAMAFLHMARVFYTAAYKAPREFNWVVGMMLFVITLMFSFTGYLLPWDQLAYWAITIGANIAASPNELAHALGLPPAFYLGDIQKELLLGASTVGQEALTRFYLLHVMLLPIVFGAVIGVHIWRIRKDGGLAHPAGTPTPAGKGVGTMAPSALAPQDQPDKTYGLMAVVKGSSPHTGKTMDETVPAWPYLMRAELLIFMVNMLICVALGLVFDAPLRELANPAVPENPAKAPWYFLGLQEMVSYSALVGGIVVPTIVVIGLALIPYLDREREPSGVWFSGSRGIRVMLLSIVVGAALAVAAVAVPVNFGWLRNWFPNIPQIVIILINPGSLLTAAYGVWSVLVVVRARSTRMGAIALFTCFLVGFAILTYVGTNLRGPNWDFYWSKSQWPLH
ncbi:MAG TPA: cytochrome b N-terminal domain-containing protein [Candidatus Hydrogenedentes bacterium]|nr:cytochrome b N-terminal domain-containing protein [Candidatus Hydrogenedentota bacterium]HOV73250.1 cytochrome b N-terminal domain-containing protein [Candidatus Hydrogenedentota bacterium]HPC16075.1 cytochrome b N-terminal domain-containing protein [Candidatus Hydrogenedentota bacterium]HRT18833.1 cytochrome b N-terminal domain-containing protein [Candidatus Hydrogenedentota bacterium]HRT65558.1 cytochrome b N-terminal domain-containing protein [Candidatus Hydrogenedentota bacterium]